jgi:hypothetical protein
MKRNIVVLSLCVAMIAPVLTTKAFGQAKPNIPTPPPASSGKNEQSNKGGQLRGLDRADQAAGEHGQQGRETARDAQLNRPDRSERAGIPDRPVRPDGPRR